jgi:lipoate-protein ligase A
MVERIEERVRNMVGPFYNMATMLKNLNNEKVSKYLYDNSENISETMKMSIEYLIDMAKIIDDHLPDGFDINELLDKRKYQKSNATKDSED